MRGRFTSLTLFALALFSLSCADERDEADKASKAIDQVRDEAAETRADIQDKQEELSRNQGDTASERGRFIAATERTLENLDREIATLKQSLAQRSKEFAGEARREIEEQLVDLENARAEAKTTFDRFRQATSDQAVKVRQETQTAVERTRAAYDVLRGRVGDQDEDPDMRGLDEEPVQPTEPTGVQRK
jgi:chromosome segregation ATPase